MMQSNHSGRATALSAYTTASSLLQVLLTPQQNGDGRRSNEEEGGRVLHQQDSQKAWSALIEGFGYKEQGTEVLKEQEGQT